MSSVAETAVVASASKEASWKSFDVPAGRFEGIVFLGVSIVLDELGLAVRIF